MPVHPTYGFVKKKRAAFGGELVVSGDGGGRWGMVSQGRGYDFDVCARLENSTVIPSLIFLKFLPKISKSDDCTLVFYSLKWRPGKIKKIGELFSKIFIFFWNFFPKNTYILTDFQKIFSNLIGVWNHQPYMVKKSFFLSSMYKNFAFYCCFKKQFSQKITKFFHIFEKKIKIFSKIFCPSILPTVL